MYYLIHLALPALAVLVMAVVGNNVEWSTYWVFALPHWVWAAISGYFEASKGSTVGGFIGAHVLLLTVWLIVASSSAPDAANGWFLYLLGSPIAITIGALVGRYIASWNAQQSA